MKLVFVLMLCVLLTACGGGGSASSPPTSPAIATPLKFQTGLLENEVAINVYSAASVNQPLVNVTVCAPQTTNCKTIENVLLDTGSFGLRLFASDIASLNLAPSTLNNQNLAQCIVFGSGYTWGPVQLADIQMSGLKASNIPIQSIDASYASVPAACDMSGVPQMTTPTKIGGARGILGVGPFQRDCGNGCATSNSNLSPPTYYTCSNTNCTAPAKVPLALQVVNPVTQFQSPYNNGLLIDFSDTSAAVDAQQAGGKLILGIDTATNNLLTAEHLILLDNRGQFTTQSNGTTYSKSFIDSGSNALFFSAPSGLSTTLSTCFSNSTPKLYCPIADVSSNAVIQSNISPYYSTLVDFQVSANRSSLNYVQPGRALTNLPGFSGWDWGFPFFYSRKIFNAIAGQSQPGGKAAPYVAF